MTWITPPVKLTSYRLSDKTTRRECATTYSLTNGRVGQQAAEKCDIASRGDSLDDLTTSHIGEELVGQKSWDKLALVCDGGGQDCAVQDVVLQKRSEQTLVLSQRLDGLVADAGERLVRGCQDGNILCTAEALDELSKAGKSENAAQAGKLRRRVQCLSERWYSTVRLGQDGARKGEDGQLGEHVQIGLQ